MKLWIKILLLCLISVFIFACDDSDSKDTADIEITNLSNLAAKVWIYNLGYTPITVTIPSNHTSTITIDDGHAGLNVNGGRAIIEYSFSYLDQESPYVEDTYVDLSPDNLAHLDIDNDQGCMVVKNYSTNQYGDMWFRVDSGPTQEIEPWEDYINFYDPSPNQSENFLIDYAGYTLFPNDILVNVEQDMITILELHPDACGIWVENNSGETISAVYISPSDSPDWGSNQLDTFIYPGSFESWRADGEVSWDVYVISASSEDTFMGIYLETDDILIIDYTSRERSNIDPQELKIDSSAGFNNLIANPKLERVIK